MFSSLSRKAITFYRRFQYVVRGRSRYGIMIPGVVVEVEPFKVDENHGDIVHPCVRYISEGFEGHCWWMVYTPYYAADSSMENPILCYSDEMDANTPPKEWKVYGLVNEKPEDGYNSDPTLLYKDGQLYVFWRENYEWSNNLHKYIRATYVARVENGKFVTDRKEILYTEDKEKDAETCPTFMRNEDGSITAYAMHLRFHSYLIKNMRPRMRSIVNKVANITDLLGVYSQQKHYGIAIWEEEESLTTPFGYMKTTPIKNCNKLYRPWHMDLFDWSGKRYAVIQTNQSNADLCLAVSEDMENFTMMKKPLITNATIGKLGIYKPCANVTPNGTFYLYYTAQDKDNRSLNKLYLTTINFNDLLAKIFYHNESHSIRK